MNKHIVLFDFDGVIVDTETQYTEFWDRMGMHYLGIENFGTVIKGQTLIQIIGEHFAGKDKERDEVVPILVDFEENMRYDYVPGAYEFMLKLKAAGIPMAIVTSSNDIKMANAYREHPELLEIADAILTSGHFSKSKPDPECFLKGMEVLGGVPERTIVFEDSLHGIEAGRASGAFVVGLSTTFSRERIAPLCNMVVPDFTELKIEDIISI